MQVDLDELEADARWISDWFDDGDRVSMPPIGEFERVASAAPSLIADLREARSDNARLREGVKEFACTCKNYCQRSAMEECPPHQCSRGRAARLLQPAKETL